MNRRILRSVVLGFVCASFPSIVVAHDPAPPEHVHRRQSRVQVALLLDTSNSMDGLIFQARTQLWTIVNEFARARRDGCRPRVEVALYEYGNDRLSRGEGYIRQVCGFTDDLDRISEKLWELTTNGGSEFCGQVIQQAVEGLTWDADPRVYKAIFIAGNEPFTQGQVDYRKSIAAAVAKGIVVNTIHCGTRDDGINGKWADGAKRGEGEFISIDQECRRVVIRCPQDDEISRLSVELNQTYIAYGQQGAAGATRQAAQDRLAAENAPAGSDVQRALAKASTAYNNAGWDLIDALREGRIKLDELKDAELPENLRAMSPKAREEFISAQQARRTELQQRIQQLSAERARYLAEQERQPAADAGETLDSAALKAVREQLRSKGWELGE